MRVAQRIESYLNPLVRLATVGLDISDETVKYLAFDSRKSGGCYRSAAFGEFKVPEGAIVKGEILKEDELVEAFTAWRTEEKRIPRSSFFTASLPEEKSFLRVVQLPNMKPEEVQHAIRWEIEANIPLAFEELIYDYEIVSSPVQTDHIDILLTAFPKTLIDAYVRVMRRAEISLSALELESQAIARSVVPDLVDNKAYLIADIGRTRTSLIVCVGGTIVFTTTIELGGELLEEHIKKAFHVDTQEAHRIKMQIGLDRTQREGAVFDALLPIMAVLADELGRIIEYYRHHAEHMHGAPDAVDSVLLVGGDANLAGLETYLSSSLRMPVRLADPFVCAAPANKFLLPPLARNKALAFATTIGLALRGIRTS